MKRRLVVALVVTLTFVGAGDASAVTNFSEYCTTGGVKTCASVQVETQAIMGGGTQVFLRVRNLQGTSLFDSTAGSLLTKIGLITPHIEGAGNLVVSTQGAAVGAGDPAGLWNIQNSPGPGNIGGVVEFSAGASNNKNGAILGCDPSNANNVTTFFRTCDSTGNTGWVVFSFTTTNSWNATDAQIAFKVQSVGPQDYSLECRTDNGSCVTTTTVTPEPLSMILMGSGLAGIAAVHRRRRREDGLVDVTMRRKTDKAVPVLTRLPGRRSVRIGVQVSEYRSSGWFTVRS
jgi:hypothetical protein